MSPRKQEIFGNKLRRRRRRSLGRQRQLERLGY
jgi:hypothetical protein